MTQSRSRLGLRDLVDAYDIMCEIDNGLLYLLTELVRQDMLVYEKGVTGRKGLNMNRFAASTVQEAIKFLSDNTNYTVGDPEQVAIRAMRVHLENLKERVKKQK